MVKWDINVSNMVRIHLLSKQVFFYQITFRAMQIKKCHFLIEIGSYIVMPSCMIISYF